LKILLGAVGRVKEPLATPIGEYESRIRRYYSFDTFQVKEEPSRQSASEARVLVEEGKRLLARVPAGLELVALDREGHAWTSAELAVYLTNLGLRGRAGAAFLIGGAFGLSGEVLQASHHRLSLSAFTLPHELARLVLAEQLYRAGTIAKGEPYHKASRSG
jgi:23S rRNA (pseudouridine1915-N3)-methyltransferase